MLKPINDVHSIEFITLACEYDGEVDAHGLTAVKEEFSRIKLKFSARRVARRNLPTATDSGSPQEEVFGYLFLNKDGDKERNRFEIVKDEMTYTSRSYINFKTFFAEAEFGLKIGDHAFKRSGKKLEKIILAYKDQYVTDDISQIIKGIRADSPYISRACLSANNFWHSSIGFFDADISTDVPYMLHNIKIHHSLIGVEDEDFLTSPGVTHALNIETYHVFFSKDIDTEEFSSVLEEAASSLRVRHKEIISAIISDELSARISLNKTPSRS